ncbi:hypothetical protein [Streptomyces daliensis]|uniref:Uncharacterized protein n=1 Tax=Streptomyces daliensis TaxID=299421 RepID=A0A8T4IZ37_9ACTN|nr:hypothetical protein [Streptomyces daliensis]
MHPARQYICMYSMKCQVCKGPASRNRDGWLFFDWRKELDPPTWPEGAVTAMPPLCDAHAKMSRELCPRLGKGHFAELRVKTPRLWGAGGTHYRLTAGGWQTDEADVWAPKGDTSLRALLVSKLIRELRDVTVIDMR